MPVADVMNVRLVSVEQEETVGRAVARMVEAGVGAVAVCEGPRLVGIFTERDVLRLAAAGAPFGATPVASVMTTGLVTIGPDDDVLAAARLMSERRIRHLPVVQGENVLGVVGIRDVLGALAERLYQAHDADARRTVQDLLRDR